MNRLKAIYRSWAIPCAGQQVYSATVMVSHSAVVTRTPTACRYSANRAKFTGDITPYRSAFTSDEECVRKFGSFTCDLVALAECRVAQGEEHVGDKSRRPKKRFRISLYHHKTAAIHNPVAKRYIANIM